MQTGRWNIVVAGSFIFVFALLGFFLGFTMEPYFEKGFYAMPYARALLKGGHTHGMPLALYNLLVGVLLGRLVLSDQWKKWCSALAMLSFFMPLGLILRGLTNGAMTFAPVAMFGILCFLASAAILIKGALGMKA